MIPGRFGSTAAIGFLSHLLSLSVSVFATSKLNCKCCAFYTVRVNKGSNYSVAVTTGGEKHLTDLARDSLSGENLCHHPAKLDKW